MPEKKVVAELRTVTESLMNATCAIMKADTDDKELNGQLLACATKLLNVAADVGRVIVDVRVERARSVEDAKTTQLEG